MRRALSLPVLGLMGGLLVIGPARGADGLDAGFVTPNPSARGLWVDGNGNSTFDRGDPHLFFDTYALGEGEPSA